MEQTTAPSNADRKKDVYTLQGTANQQAMSARSAEKQAAFFLPYLQAGMQLLDCGSGPGSITIGLAKRVAPGLVIGMDIEAAQIDGANALAVEQGVTNVRFETGNVYALPYADASMDAVFSNALLEHLSEPKAALQEMYRVLKPGGVIGIRTTDADGNITYPRPSAFAQWREWTEQLKVELGHNIRIGKQLRSLLRAAGFVRIQGSASYDYSGTPEATRKVGESFAATIRKSWSRDQILARGWADRAELETIAEAIQQWGDNPDAFVAQNRCEAVGWRDDSSSDS
jgi:ubiquinone/menaquinone biosynthesis C-methylase UbiE